MVDRTSTDFAQWTLIERNDKRHPRVKLLSTCCDARLAALKKHKKKSRD